MLRLLALSVPLVMLHRGFIHSVSGAWLLLGGFSCWLFHLAGSQACALLPLALLAFRLQGWPGGGGGGGLLPLDLRGSGVGTVSFRPFSDGCLSLHWQAWRDRGPEPWVVVVLRFGYCLPFLGSPPFSMLRSLYFLTAPLPSRVLLWRRSPWPSLPWVQWCLLLSLLQGFLQPSLRDVVVLGVLGVQSWPSPISFVFVTVSPFPMVAIQSVLLSVCQGTGWPTSFSGQRFFRCRSILLLVTFCASSSETLFLYSRLSALSFP